MESALSRGGRGGNAGGFHVAGGNYFSAKPIGVRNGLDYGCSGEVRKVEADRIRYMSYASVNGCHQKWGYFDASGSRGGCAFACCPRHVHVVI